MSKKSFRNSWRRGDMGMGQIAAMLLVVLPTLVFSVTFIIAYWSVMQADYSVKLVANMSSDFYDSIEDRNDINSTSVANLVQSASRLCPKNLPITGADVITNSSVPGEVSVTVQYTTPDGLYFANKTISTTMHTYSYHDQNISVTLTCPKQ